MASKKEKPTVKILVAYHRPAALLKDEVFTPIQGGRAIASQAAKDGAVVSEDIEWMLKNTIGDDTGDNISDQNRYLNEFTSFYWAWKNYEKLGNPDYIGLMHYRRHLCFNLENQEIPDHAGLLPNRYLDEDYIEKYALKADVVRQIVKDYDIVVAEKCDVRPIGTENCYDHYRSADPKVLHIEDYETVMDIIKRKYPEYSEAIRQYNESVFAYFTNVFIMKKPLFFEYMDWINTIVEEAREKVDVSSYNVSEARAVAYITEWLFGIWFTHLKNTREVKTLELKRPFVKEPFVFEREPLKPAFSKNNVAICMSCDENYLPYLGVTIQSIIDNASYKSNYDINIFVENITASYRKRFSKMARDNISIRFVDIGRYTADMNNAFFTTSHFTKAVYYRFFIPKIFSEYKKILYIDCDLVVNRDIADLYNTELSDAYLLGAVRDCEIVRMAAVDKRWGEKYLKEFVGIKKIADYFQSGVCLMNVKQMVKENLAEKLFNKLVELKNPSFVDQDVLNAVCQERVLFLDLKWNVEYHIPLWHKNWMSEMPVSLLYDYIESRENPYIIHFAGCKKPWQNTGYDMGEYFWKYAKNSPFYEEILYRNLFSVKVPDVKADADMDMLKKCSRYFSYYFKYLKYKVMSKITFGRKRKKYKQKKKAFKREIKQIRKYLNK